MSAHGRSEALEGTPVRPFVPDTATGNGMRRAALALHGLAAGDRDWLLQRIEPAQAERMRGLLHELDALGARFDPADLAALTQPAAPPGDPVLAIAPPLLARAVAQQPDWAVAALAASLDAPARAHLLAACAPARVQGVAELMHEAPAPAAGAALVAALLRDLPALGSEPRRAAAARAPQGPRHAPRWSVGGVLRWLR